MALAQLEQQELRQGGLTDREIQAKEESIIRSYRRRHRPGSGGSAIVREAVRLLFKHKRGSEALDLLNSIPMESQLASDIGRRAMSVGDRKPRFRARQEFARRAVAANPADLQERIWLVKILISQGHQAEAETEIREAIDLSKGDADRWIMLVQFLVLTRQPARVAQVIKEAEAPLQKERAPVALA